MIKNIIIGLSFPEKIDPLINSILKNKNGFVVSNLIYERKMAAGFENICKSCNVFISAPSIGTYPNNVSVRQLNINDDIENNYYYARYHLRYIIKNFSKAINLKRAFKRASKNVIFEKNVNVFVSELHTPYIRSAFYIKKLLGKKKIDVKICQLVPDLPINVYNEDTKNNIIYKILKKISYFHILKLIKKVDSFILFSKSMNSVVNKQNKDFLVIPGIQDIPVLEDNCIVKSNCNNRINILFSAKLQEKNGILLTLEAMKYLPKDKYQLTIAGYGEEIETVKKYAKIMPNIRYVGYISPNEVKKLQQKSDIILSLRLPTWKGTEYSFPSKFFEALSCGKMVVTFKLPTYDKDVDDFVFYPKSERPESIASAIESASCFKEKDLIRKKELNYLLRYSPDIVASKMISICDRIRKK